jgi:hypothetical protein
MPDKKPRWRVVCSCGWEREASSARADASRRPLVVNSLGTSIDVGIRYQYTVHQDSPTRAEATLQVVPVPSEAVALASRLEFVLGVGRRDGCGGHAANQA